MHPSDSTAVERAVIAVLAGTPIEQAAARLHAPPEHLAQAIELYRSAGRTALNAHHTTSDWQQLNIEFADYQAAHRTFISHLLAPLREASDAGTIGAWWFVRKYPCWRLRLAYGPQTTSEDASDLIHDALNTAASNGAVNRWWPSPYEPETTAFGGPEGMKIAHDLFYSDSVGTLTYLQATLAEPHVPLSAKATSLVNTSLLLRAAGQEWSEQGDVWARVEAKRPLPDDVPVERVTAMTGALHRLLTLDTAPARTAGNPLAPLADWANAVERGGQALGHAGREGRLTLGTRGILARHILFHWNRMGFTTRQQAIWSRAARLTILGD